MTIRFSCPTCGKPIAAKDEYAGKRGTCSGCGEKALIPSTASTVTVAAARTQTLKTKPVEVLQPTAEIPCPFCSEFIKPAAKKCRHCGEFIDATAKTETEPKRNRTVAILLGILLPGLGHVYSGKPIAGIAWFVAAALGYAAFAIPGFAVHVWSVISLARYQGKLATVE